MALVGVDAADEGGDRDAAEVARDDRRPRGRARRARGTPGSSSGSIVGGALDPVREVAQAASEDEADRGLRKPGLPAGREEGLDGAERPSRGARRHRKIPATDATMHVVEQAADHRAQREPRQVAAPLGRERAVAADLDPDAREVGEPAQRVRGDQAAALGEPAPRRLAAARSS